MAAAIANRSVALEDIIKEDILLENRYELLRKNLETPLPRS
jgi:hypothetical protein